MGKRRMSTWLRVAAGAIVALGLVGAIELSASGGSHPAAAPPSCTLDPNPRAERAFSADGHHIVSIHFLSPKRHFFGLNPAVSGDPIYGRWLDLFCASVRLGPATSRVRHHHHLYPQEFARTAHKVIWNAKTNRVWIRKQPAVAAKVFSQLGIKPQWDLPVPAAWLKAYYAGTDYGPALDPVAEGATISWQRQEFAQAVGTYRSGAVAFVPRTGAARLYDRALWGPIGHTVQAFGSDIVGQQTPAA